MSYRQYHPTTIGSLILTIKSISAVALSITFIVIDHVTVLFIVSRSKSNPLSTSESHFERNSYPTERKHPPFGHFQLERCKHSSAISAELCAFFPREKSLKSDCRCSRLAVARFKTFPVPWLFTYKVRAVSAAGCHVGWLAEDLLVQSRLRLNTKKTKFRWSAASW